MLCVITCWSLTGCRSRHTVRIKLQADFDCWSSEWKCWTYLLCSQFFLNSARAWQRFKLKWSSTSLQVTITQPRQNFYECQLMIAKTPNQPLVHSTIKNHHDGPLTTVNFHPRKFKISAKVPLVRNKGLPSGWMWQEDITFSIQISASQNPQCPTEMERKTVQSFLGNQEVMGWRRTLYLV